MVGPLMYNVALRKESVDRNIPIKGTFRSTHVALRKESVDRNVQIIMSGYASERSLSARRAWIEIVNSLNTLYSAVSRSPQGERG